MVVRVGHYLLFMNGNTWRSPITIYVYRNDEFLGQMPTRTMDEHGVWFHYREGNIEMYPWHVIDGMEWVPE